MGFLDSVGNFFTQDIVNPIENVGNALIHGDITGGQYQASGSDYLTAAADVAGIAGLGLGVGALAGGLGGAAGLGAGAAADAAGSAAPLGFAAPDASLGAAGPDLSGFLGDTPITTDTGLPFAGGAETPPITPNAYVAQNFGDFQGVGAPGLAQGESSGALAMQPVDASPIPAVTGDTGPFPGGGVPNASAPNVGSAIQTSTVPSIGGAPTAPSALSTLMNPGSWTLPGVAQGAGVAAAGGLLAANLLKSNAPPPGSQNLTNVAGAGAQTFQQQAAIGTQLQSYLANGTLPAPQQAQIDQLISAQKMKIISSYAARGQDTSYTTDANGNKVYTNSALNQDLNSADQQGLVMASQMESQLFANGQQALQTGLNALGVSQQSYTTLANMNQTQNTQFGNAVAGFAAAATGGGKGLSVNLGGTKTA
jgi:hypothetical protein